MSPIEYQEAVEHPELRREYVGQIDREWARPYIARILYKNCDVTNNNREQVMMDCLSAIRSNWGFTEGRATLRVYPVSFLPNIHASEGEFLSTLLDHEGWHAYEMYQRPDLLDVDCEDLLLEIVCRTNPFKAFMNKCNREVRAHEHQLLQIAQGNRHVTTRHVERLHNALSLQRRRIHSAQCEIQKRVDALLKTRIGKMVKTVNDLFPKGEEVSLPSPHVTSSTSTLLSAGSDEG